MYNPNVPSSNMGIAPVSSAPSQPLGPTPMMGMAPMGPPPPMAPPMMGGMPPPPMGAPMGPPPIAPITEGLGGFGGSRAGRAGFSERMQQMTAPPKPRPMPMQQPQQMQQPMMQRPMGMMSGGIVPSRVEPLKMALGGFIGNSSTRDYGGDRYTDPYEELDDLYEDVGGYDPTDPYGDNSTGDDSGGEDDYGYLDDDYVYVPPAVPDAIGPPVVVPEESGSDSEQRMIQDLIYGSTDPTIGPNSAEEAIQQAVADNKAGNFDLADSSLAKLAGRISRGSDVMPARLGSIDAISQDFAVPKAADTTFSDPDEIFDLSNPISLNAAQVVGPNSRTDASGNLIPGRSDTAADIEAGTEAALNLGPEVMSSDPASSGDMRDVNLGLSPVISGMSDSLLAGTNFPPASPSSNATMMPSFLPDIIDPNTPLAPEFVEPTPAEIQASNRRAMAEARDDAAIPSDIQLEMAQPTGGGYQPNLRRGPFGPIGPESSFPGLGKVNSLALPADAVFPQASAEQIGGGITGSSTRPGMGSDDPIVYNDTPSGPVFTRPDGTVLTPADSAAINAQARLDANPPTGFDTMALEEAAYPKGNIVDETFPQSPGDIFSTPSTDGSFQFSGLGDPLNGVTTDVSRIADDMRQVIGEDIQNPPQTLRQATGRAPMTSEEAILNMSGIDSAGNAVSLAGKSGYDSPEAAANRATDLAQTADETNIFDGDNFSIPPAPERTLAGGNTTTEGGAQLLQSALSKVASGSIGDLTIAEQYALKGQRGETPNKGETNLIRNAMAGARHTEDGPGYKKGDLVVEDRFADKLLSGFETALSFLLPGSMDFKAMSQANRNKALQAYKDTGKIVYEEGKPVGFEDKEGGLVRLVPKGQDDTGGDDDGCPPGFRRVNGVCMPIQRVAQNPATAISDSIEKSTLPSTLRPIVRDVVDDEDEEEETSDVGGLTIRRPSYFAGGGAVSDGMGSAIDNFLSSMGGSVKKKI